MSRATHAQTEILNRLDDVQSSQQAFQATLLSSLQTLKTQLLSERNMHDETDGTSITNAVQDVSYNTPSNPVQGNITTPSPAADMRSPISSRFGDVAKKVQSRMPLAHPGTAIPPDHTTGWARILEWPAVANFTGDFIRTNEIGIDPLKEELKVRPQVRSTNMPQYEIRGDYSSPSKTFPMVYENLNSPHIEMSAPETWSDDLPDENALDESKINRLAHKFLVGIGKMHPIITPEQLGKLLLEFQSLLAEVRTLLASQTHANDRVQFSFHYVHPVPPWTAEQAVQAALVLLVLSLGEVCESSEQSSRSFRDSSSGEAWRVDNAPGLAFFAAATTLLSLQTSTTSCAHVQAYILAGLYLGQFSRILESHKYYSKASYSLYLLLKPYVICIYNE